MATLLNEGDTKRVTKTTGNDVLLKWKPTDNKKRKAAAGTNAFDQIAQQDKRQRRAMAKGAGA